MFGFRAQGSDCRLHCLGLRGYGLWDSGSIGGKRVSSYMVYSRDVHL